MRFLYRSIRIIIILIFVLGTAMFFFMQQPAFGRLPAGDRLQKISRSPQYKNGVFTNIHPTPQIAENASYLSMVSEYFKKGIDREPTEKLPVVETALENLPLTDDQLVWFGHSSYLIILDGKKILVDPVFSDRASPVSYIGKKRYEGTFNYSAEDLPAVDALIITHDHYDHLDYNSILKLKDRATHFYCPLGVGSHLEHWGITPEKITELDWWENVRIDEKISLTATPARHFSGRGIRANKTLWASYVLKSSQRSLFLGGDSGYDDTFKKIGEKYGPFDLALLECGQYDKQWPYIHMMPEEVAQAAQDLRSRYLLPVHWGKFTLALHTWTDPIVRVSRAAESKGVALTTPKIGEITLLSNLGPGSAWW
jgi:L-ascorbate metabolism protein UlaG (beta-lactamase superfamily)